MLRILAFALMLPTPVLTAVSIPLSGGYGDCVNGAEPTLDATSYNDGEIACTVAKVRGTHVTFSCPGEDPGPNDKPTLVKATVIENKAAGTVTITGIDQKPITLARCK